MQPKGLLLILLKAKKTFQEDFLFQRFILITSRLVKGVPILDGRYTKEVPFRSKTVYRRVRAGPWGRREASRRKLC